MIKYSPESIREMANAIEHESVAPGEVDKEGLTIASMLNQAADNADALKRLLDACYFMSRYAASERWAEFHEARTVAELASGHVYEDDQS